MGPPRLSSAAVERELNQERGQRAVCEPCQRGVASIGARMEFDGKLIFYSESRDIHGQPTHTQIATTNITRIRDVERFILSL